MGKRWRLKSLKLRVEWVEKPKTHVSKPNVGDPAAADAV
jgi:hypothetical protein